MKRCQILYYGYINIFPKKDIEPAHLHAIKTSQMGVQVVVQNGFLYDFAVCQGVENPKKEKSDVCVLKMTTTLPAE